VLAIEDRGRWLWYDAPGVKTGSIWLREPVLAVGAGAEHSSVIDASGVVWEVSRRGLRIRRRLALPAGVKRAAVSPRGDLCVIAVDLGPRSTSGDPPGRAQRPSGPPPREIAVQVLHGNRWESVHVPDFLEDITDLGCAEDGKTFGYAFLCGQPWGEDGDHFCLGGAMVLSASGRPLSDTGADRAFDDQRARRILAWGRDGNPLVLTCKADPSRRHGPGSTTVKLGGGRPLAALDPDPSSGPLGMRFETVIDMLDEEAVRAAISPDGTLVGAVDRTGHAHLLDLARRRRRKLAEGILAMDLASPGVAGVVTVEGLWLRARLPEDGWESLNPP
jgi:hypothetical protein